VSRREFKRRRRGPAGDGLFDDVKSAEVLFGKSKSGRDDRKTQQLCRQVERTLSLALSGGFGDLVLSELMVESVVPAPDATRLLVNLRRISAGESGNRDANVSDIYQRLERISGALRHEVAQAITRKRAPELMFRIVAEPEVQP